MAGCMHAGLLPSSCGRADSSMLQAVCASWLVMQYALSMVCCKLLSTHACTRWCISAYLHDNFLQAAAPPCNKVVIPQRHEAAARRGTEHGMKLYGRVCHNCVVPYVCLRANQVSFIDGVVDDNLQQCAGVVLHPVHVVLAAHHVGLQMAICPWVERVYKDTYVHTRRPIL